MKYTDVQWYVLQKCVIGRVTWPMRGEITGDRNLTQAQNPRHYCGAGLTDAQGTRSLRAPVIGTSTSTMPEG